MWALAVLSTRRKCLVVKSKSAENANFDQHILKLHFKIIQANIKQVQHIETLPLQHFFFEPKYESKH